MPISTFTVSFPSGTDHDKLFAHIRDAMPAPFRGDRPFEDIHAVAAQYELTMAQMREWSAMMFITTATGVWLDAHAQDRGTFRQAGETDEELRARIKTLQDVVTEPALLAAAQAIVDAAGIVGVVAYVNLRRDRAFYGPLVADTGTGGTFSALRGVQGFEPATDFAGPPFRDIAPTVEHRLVISGAAAPANNGTFTITGLAEDAALFVNGGFSPAVDGGLAWSVTVHDVDGNERTGFQRSYYSRGYRYGSSGLPGVYILILPYGCAPATVLSVEEMIRQRGPGGFIGLVECRLTP